MRAVILFIAMEFFSVWLRIYSPAEYEKYKAEMGGMGEFLLAVLLLMLLMDLFELAKK